MSEQMSDWMKGVRAALKAGGLSEDNNVAIGMAQAMRAGRDEKSLSEAEGREMGADAARRCKYHQR
jgi:hypothetical protein